MSNSLKTLVTGANGFVGSALLQRLQATAIPVRAATRARGGVVAGVENQVVGNLDDKTDWAAAVAGVDVVVHLAARVHVMAERSRDPAAEFRRINVTATEKLAWQAAAGGVRRLLFLSSIKVNGEASRAGWPFCADDAPHPVDDYAVSKYEAELVLQEISTQTGMEVVIIRPPLIYGPGVRANFQSMMSWLACGVPLPFASITGNRRSLAAMDNLIDLIMTCMHHPAAGNQTFLVSDGEELSTTELLRRLGNALGKPARLLPVSPYLLEFGARLVGKKEVAQRLLGNLQVDISKTKDILSWSPPVGVDEGLRKTADWYLSRR